MTAGERAGKGWALKALAAQQGAQGSPGKAFKKPAGEETAVASGVKARDGGAGPGG